MVWLFNFHQEEKGQGDLPWEEKREPGLLLRAVTASIRVFILPMAGYFTRASLKSQKLIASAPQRLSTPPRCRLSGS